MGRAPATALAYMYWFREYTLEGAFIKLFDVRPCNPRLQAVREATCDVLIDQGRPTSCELHVLRSGYSQPPKVTCTKISTRVQYGQVD